MRSRTARIERPFTGGKVTEVAEDRLEPTQTRDLENAILVNGVAQERNGVEAFADNDLFSGGGKTGGLWWNDDSIGSSGGVRLVETTTGAVGVTASPTPKIASVNQLAASVPSPIGVFPLVEYGGEAILGFEAPFQRGVHEPFRRWAGVDDDDLTSGTGTYSVTAGQKRAAGSGSNFDPDVKPNSYLNTLYRVARVSSDTEIGLHNNPDQTYSGVPVTPTATGFIGLKTLVTRLGVTSHTSSGGTVTGKGTAWASTNVPGNGRVQEGDYILLAEGADLTEALRVTAVGGNESLTVASNTVGAWTDQVVYVLRYLVGDCITAHRGRLYASGIAWAGDRLQVLPQGYDLGQVTNGNQSPLNDAARAAEVESVEMPNPTATGRIIGLGSHDAGLIIARSDSLYIARNEWPATSFDKLGDIGCLNRGACLAARGSVFIAGPQGVWEFDGSLRELSAPRASEWQSSLPGVIGLRMHLGAADDHLFVAVGASGSMRMWVYDLLRRVWVGDMTMDDTTGIPQIDEISFLLTGYAGGYEDRLLAYTASTASGERCAIDLASAVRVNGDGETTIHTGRGRFMGVLPPSATGPSSRRRRIIGAKVSYTLDATSGTLDVSSSVDTSAYASERSLPDNSGGGDANPRTARVFPGTGQLGVSGRQHRLRLQRSAAASSVRRLAVHEVELNVREGRVRA